MTDFEIATVLVITLLITTFVALVVSFWSLVGYAAVRLIANVSVASSLPQGIKVSNNTISLSIQETDRVSKFEILISNLFL